MRRPGSSFLWYKIGHNKLLSARQPSRLRVSRSKEQCLGDALIRDGNPEFGAFMFLVARPLPILGLIRPPASTGHTATRVVLVHIPSGGREKYPVGCRGKGKTFARKPRWLSGATPFRPNSF